MLWGATRWRPMLTCAAPSAGSFTYEWLLNTLVLQQSGSPVVSVTGNTGTPYTVTLTVLDGSNTIVGTASEVLENWDRIKRTEEGRGGGGPFGDRLKVPEDGLHGGYTSHFFGAVRLDALRDAAAFKRDLDRELRTFKESAPAPGHERVRVAGEPEHEFTQRFRREGVPINEKVWEVLDAMADRLKIAKLERFSVA